MSGLDFGTGFKNYEVAMRAHNYFGITDKAERSAQFGRYALGLQYQEQKDFNRWFGRQYAREIANGRASAPTNQKLPLALTGTSSSVVSLPSPVEMPEERISLVGFNAKKNKRLQRKLYRQEQRLLTNGSAPIKTKTGTQAVSSVMSFDDYVTKVPGLKNMSPERQMQEYNNWLSSEKWRNGQTVGSNPNSLGNKISNFCKSKAGKIALIGLGAAALIGGAIWLYNKSKDKAEHTVTTPVETPVTPVETPVTPVETPVTPVETPAEPVIELLKYYEVKPGDNVWNIAKQHLIDLSDDPNYKPTNNEILQHTKELIELNKLKYEKDGRLVIIKPKQKLKLIA